jgi:hypothetical protein
LHVERRILQLPRNEALVDFDWTVGFAINAELASSLQRYKQQCIQTFIVYKTDGDLGDDALEVLKIATELFLEAEMKVPRQQSSQFDDNCSWSEIGHQASGEGLRFLGRDMSAVSLNTKL